MNSNYCSLIVIVKAYSIQSQEIEYSYKRGCIEELDKITYQYTDKFDFFNHNKDKILENLNQNKEKYNLVFDVTDIELIKIEIKREKEERGITPFFQHVIYKEKSINMDDWLLKNLIKNRCRRLFQLYQIDKTCEMAGNYESIFNNIEPYFLEFIELDCIFPDDVREILNNLKRKRRFFQIARFLLAKEEDVTLENFRKMVPSYETIKRENTEPIRKREPWLPYPND